MITPLQQNELIVRNTNKIDALYCVGSRSEMEFWVVCSIATALVSSSSGSLAMAKHGCLFSKVGTCPTLAWRVSSGN